MPVRHTSDVSGPGFVTPNGAKLPILCYHKVGPASENGRRLNIEAARLDSHVRFFQRRNCRFMTGRELSATWPEKSVCFTFDDGFVSTLTYGREVLDRRRVRGTFYAVTSLVGKASDWEGDRGTPIADWETLLDAAVSGHEIGNHTRTHPFMNRLGMEAQIEEIAGARDDLAARGLGGSFCFPYGAVGDRSRDAMKGAGVTVGMTLRKAWAKEGDDRLLLPRLTVAYGDALPLLLYRLYIRPMLP